MKKAQYLSNLAARSEILSVGTASLVDTDSAGIALYEVQVFEVNDAETAGIRKTHKFYVYDDGGTLESAFSFRAAPEKELSPSGKFVQTALDWIYANGHADVAEIQSSDNDRMKIIARLHKTTTAPNAETKTAILWKPNGSPVQIRYLP